jgi:YgiT-type zinc finger domain-containing protein
MICLICRQAEVLDSLTSVSFQRGEMYLTVKDVPARLCQSCGEAYVDEAVARRLLQSVEEMYKAGRLEEAMDYAGLYLKQS